jgi:hypothetical protein
VGQAGTHLHTLLGLTQRRVHELGVGDLHL